MKLGNLGKELDNNLGNIYKCILINGTWGIGKSHYINNYIKDRENIYRVSLFGIENIKEFKDSISYYFSNIIINGIKDKLEIDKPSFSFNGINIPMPELKDNLKNKIRNKLNKKGSISLIIDDLERTNKSIDMVDILGIIEELNQIENLYIIVIANEEEISNNDYKKFKEKVIEREYYIDEYTNEAVDNICSLINNSLLKESISNLYFNSKSKNLRTLVKTSKFLNQIISNINIDELTETNANTLAKCVLYFMISFNEYPEEFKLDNDLPKKVTKKYFDKEINVEELDLLLTNIYYYYTSNDNKYCKIIEENLRIKKIVEPKKKLFYCSKQELYERAKEFKNDVIKNYNKDFNILSFFRELSNINYFLSIIGKENYYKDEDIIKAIDMYIDKIDLNQLTVYELINDLFDFSETTFYKKYIDIIRKKIFYKYIDFYIESIEIDLKENQYDCHKVETLYEMLTNYELTKYINNEIMEKLKKNNFFIIDLRYGLTRGKWDFVRSIFKSLECLVEENIVKKEINNYLYKLLVKSKDIEEYRIKWLIEKYNLKN